MTIERKSGTLAGVTEGKAMVRLATLQKVDMDHDVIEGGFFPPKRDALVVSIQPYHKHDVPSMGHATVWEDAAKGEIFSQFEFNDSVAAQEQWKVLKWDYEHGAIQEFSWAFRPKPGAARPGTFEGQQVRFLGKAGDGGYGVTLIEAGPVLRGASVNSGLLSVRSHDAHGNIGPGHPRYSWLERMYRKSQLVGEINQIRLQVQAQQLLSAFDARNEAIREWRGR